MSKKGGNFFEEHIEKLVLAIIGLVCLWLFVTHVLISPNYIEYDNDRFSSDDIDNYISRQAEILEDKLNRKPEPKQTYDPCFPAFAALVDSAISEIDVSLHLPVAPHISREIIDNREYRTPLIGKVTDVGVEHIRAVAYVPNGDLDEKNIYSPDNSEPDDIDFVTVEGKFDVAGLYESFYESFAGEGVQEQWRDPCLASPIFAAVQLQRQEMFSNGSWSDWQIVSRTKIDHRKKMFEVIEELEELPAGGIKVRLLQFNDAVVTMDLLQPEAYRIASAKEEWFPPSLHKEFVEQQREMDAQEKRVTKAAEREEREREREGERSERRSRTPKTRLVGAMGGGGPPGYGGGGGGPPGYGGGMGGGTSARKTQPRRSRSERKIEKERIERSKEDEKTKKDVYKEFDEILITEKTDIDKMDEPLVFWAHDDTIEPKKSYRYKIRLGVFNPIAGTNKFTEQEKSLKNKVILWSEFSDATETVDVPGLLYFFPYEIQEAAKTVTVQVSRYVLGYWYSKDFTVKQGEVIGKAIKYEPAKEEEEKEVTVPETINCSTGVVLVDIIPVNDWSGGKNLRARHYFDMLYSFDGTNIERVPIKSRYWAEGLQIKFNEIKRAEKESKEPLRDWGSRPGQRRLPQQPGMPPGLGPPGYGAPPGYGGPPPGYGY